MAASVHVLAEPPAVGHVDSHSILQRRDSVYMENEEGEKQKVCSLSFQEECQALEQRLKSHERGVLNPDSAGVQRWDSLTFALLIFTAVITPFEVAYLTVKTKQFLFWINRLVDLVFIADIFVQFRLAFRDETKGSMLIKSQKKIAYRYGTTWFPIDVMSVLPFEILSIAIKGSAFSKLKVVRLVRLLRLLKLMRVLRANRLLARYETKISVSYATLAMTKYVVLLVVVAHWMACVWGMSLDLAGDNAWTWADALRELKKDPYGVPQFDKGRAGDVYVRALYFAIYCLTGIGLGDVSPVTNLETGLCCCFFIIGGIFWAYTVGNFCSIVSTMDVQGILFRQRMDELNAMLADRKVPDELRQRCRMYFFQSKENYRTINYKTLEMCFSTTLRAELAAATNSAWISKVWYLKDAAPSFTAELSQNLSPMVFAPMEVLSLPFTLFILRRGIAARRGRVLAKGSVWGEDFIVENDELVDGVFAAALTYAEVLALSYQSFHAILDDHADFCDVEKAVHRARVFYTVRARLTQKGREIFEEKRKTGEIKKARGLNIISRSVGHRGMQAVQTKSMKGARFGAFAGPNLPDGGLSASPPQYERKSGRARQRHTMDDRPPAGSPPKEPERATFPAGGAPSPRGADDGFEDLAGLPGGLPAAATGSASTSAVVTPTGFAADADASTAVAPFQEPYEATTEVLAVEPVSEPASPAAARKPRDDLAVADLDDDLDEVAKSLA
ncbi:voltage-gated potassium channel [Aureococcus anophagefferens]|uniref:Voltage-gated potassium channel n=1 Tax=Aureococcus anophagefferens TaxID=44056 RepID=A0ABR1FLJ8_AURAN